MHKFVSLFCSWVRLCFLWVFCGFGLASLGLYQARLEIFRLALSWARLFLKNRVLGHVVGPVLLELSPRSWVGLFKP